MNSIFQTGVGDAPPANPILAIQASEDHFAFVLTDRAGDQLYQLQYFSIQDWNAEVVNEVLSKLPSSEVGLQGVEIVCETNEFTIVPVTGFQEDKLAAIHEALHPHTRDKVLKMESLAEWQMYIGYSAPAILMNTLQHLYPEARIRHSLKLFLQQAGQSGMQGKLLVSIRPRHFFGVLLRNNRFQFAKEFLYENPADVLYYLLRICEDHLISPNEVEIELTGLIDQESALFVELWQYFSHLRIRAADWKTAQNDFPAHYFTHLNDLVKCAL